MLRVVSPPCLNLRSKTSFKKSALELVQLYADTPGLSCLCQGTVEQLYLRICDLSQFNELGFEESLKLAACLQVLLFFC